MSSTRSLLHLYQAQETLIQACIETILAIAGVHPQMVVSPVMDRAVRLLVDVTVRSFRRHLSPELSIADSELLLVQPY
jgi:hypothetical protein